MKKRIISLFCALLLLAPGFLLRERGAVGFNITTTPPVSGTRPAPPWTVSPQSTGR